VEGEAVNAEEAIGRVEAWLRDAPDGDRTVGEWALRVQREYVVRVTDGWHVPFNAVGYLDRTDIGKGLFPNPVLFVPDDGGELRYAAEVMAASSGPAEEDGFTEWEPIVDPEFDRDAFPGLDVPEPAILGWEQFTGFGDPTGTRRTNPAHTVGPVWRGYPPPLNRTESLIYYRQANWIDRHTFLRQLVDCEVLVLLDKQGEPQVQRHSGDVVDYPVFSSSVMIPAGHTRWRRVRIRELLDAIPGSSIVLNPGWLWGERFHPDELRSSMPSTPNGEARGDVTDEVAAEADPRVRSAVAELSTEFGVEPPGLLASHLAQVAGQARKKGYELTVDECLAYARGCAWKFRNLRGLRNGMPPRWPADLAANGLVAYWAADGTVRPEPWTFGKFFEKGTPDATFAWHRIVGAFVGFALGDALGSNVAEHGEWNGAPLRMGGLTRQLLLQTASVIRGLPSQLNEDGSVPATLPSADGTEWLLAATRDAGPAPVEPSALLATALAATVVGNPPMAVAEEPYARQVARALLGTAATAEITSGVDTLVWLFWRMLAAEEFVLPVHIRLEEIVREQPESWIATEARTVLTLRDERDEDDRKQIETLGDGHSARSVLSRALFAAAKRGYDPEQAILAAVRQSGCGDVTGALAGALVGAKWGVPGLPASWVAALPHLGLVANIASDAFYHFHRFGVAQEMSEGTAWEQRYPRG
jgi:hypothetical protein